MKRAVTTIRGVLTSQSIRYILNTRKNRKNRISRSRHRLTLTRRKSTREV